MATPAPQPWNLIAKLSYRCPLRCPYCSNPLTWSSIRDGLDAAAWSHVFAQAAALGCVHVGLTGGEPSVRRDLDAIVAAADAAGLYVHLVTAGVPLEPAALPELASLGLRSVQLSIQHAEPTASDAIAGTASFARKLAVARAVRSAGLALTLNVVLHRHNLDRVPALIALARELDADRLELAHVQYEGWALPNRAALLPTRAQVDAAARAVRDAQRHATRPEILLVLPDWFAGRPKPCMGGWARRLLVVAPDGLVLPCHAARDLPDLAFWNVRERDLRACWEDAPGMNAFRGEDWMRDPCRTCPDRARDFGGCRCQAFRWTGDAANPDPACALVPDHDRLVTERDASSADAQLRHRR